MLRSVGNYGRGLKPPTMYELRTWILQEEVNTTKALVAGIKDSWKSTGVSLLSDGWSDMRNRSLINFLVNNPHGTVFLKTVDASECIKNADKIFELLDAVVEEIGEDIVVQVVTDNASNYKKAGELLMEKRKSLYWTPCAAHCIDLMLEKIAELTQLKRALIKAKKISNFIYNHQWVLSLAQKFLKKDLLRPAATRFATAFLTLESVYELKEPLQQMFFSSEWNGSAWAKKRDGIEVKKIIIDEKIFWPSVVYSLKTTKPLVEVLRVVDGERSPAMAFIYGAMDECKEKIASNFDNKKDSYKEIWDIIDEKWQNQMHRDLHATAYYLNPQFRWSPNVSNHPEIKLGLYRCMDRLVKNEVYMKIESQLDDYKYKKGLFGHRASLNSYMKRVPITWWDNYGDEVPELKAFAMKILGLTCSASACERNWSTFNQVHTKRRNRLSTDRMNKLVYVMYNRRLKQKFIKKANLKDDEDPIVADEILSDDEWIANSSGDEDEDEDGMVGVGGSNEEEGESSSRRKRKRVITLVDEDDDDDLNPPYENLEEEEDDDDDDAEWNEYHDI
ncbi:putative HAT dimerization domain, ribonuclease H-like superfamily [Helianthus anomalus]